MQRERAHIIQIRDKYGFKGPAGGDWDGSKEFLLELAERQAEHLSTSLYSAHFHCKQGCCLSRQLHAMGSFKLKFWVKVDSEGVHSDDA
jgi:hypothetical protein